MEGRRLNPDACAACKWSERPGKPPDLVDGRPGRKRRTYAGKFSVPHGHGGARHKSLKERLCGASGPLSG